MAKIVHCSLMFSSCNFHLHNLLALLQLLENLLPPPIRELGIDERVLDVYMPQVILHILNSLSGFQEVRGNGVSQGMYRELRVQPGLAAILPEQLLNPLPFQRALPAGEERGSGVQPHGHIRFQQLRCIAEQRPLAALPMFESMDDDPASLRVHILQLQQSGFRDPQAIVIDGSEQRPVAGIGDGGKELDGLRSTEIPNSGDTFSEHTGSE